MQYYPSPDLSKVVTDDLTAWRDDIIGAVLGANNASLATMDAAIPPSGPEEQHWLGGLVLRPARRRARGFRSLGRSL